MKNRFIFYRKLCLSLKKGTPIAVMVVTGLIFPHLSIAQPESMPEGSIYFIEYTVEDQLRFLLPDTTDIDAITEWDWIEMEPEREVREHRKIINSSLQQTEEIHILNADENKDWEYDIGSITIGTESTVIYNQTDEVISTMPHSAVYLSTQDEMAQSIMDHGLLPPLPFPPFEELPIEDLQNEGYSVTETEHGYVISNDIEELTINAEEQIRVHRLLTGEYGVPYYEYSDYTLSAQGYRIPSFKKVRTKILSENGYCIVKVQSETFPEYIAYYNPILVYEEEGEDLSSDFSMFPNPTEFNFEIEYTGEVYIDTFYDISITNQMGEPVYSQEGLNTSTIENITVSSLPEGFYIVHFTIDGNHFTKTILKN